MDCRDKPGNDGANEAGIPTPVAANIPLTASLSRL